MPIQLIDDAANILFLCGFLFRDILLLRTLSTTGYLTVLPYYYLQPEPLWTPIVWTLLFIAINAYHIRRLLRDRRPLGLEGEELALYELVSDDIRPAEFRKLLAAGQWRDVPAGTALVEAGGRLDEAGVLLSGGAVAKKGDRHLANFEPGDLVGAASLLHLENTAPADIHFDSDSRMLCWKAKALEQILASDGELRAAFQSLMAKELAARVRHLVELVPASVSPA